MYLLELDIVVSAIIPYPDIQALHHIAKSQSGIQSQPNCNVKQDQTTAAIVTVCW